ALLHDDLVHIHASGQVETKAQFLASARQRLRFLRIERGDYSVRLAGENAAIGTGGLKQRVRVEASGQEVDMDIITTQVWVRGGDGWRQLHFQATARRPL